MGWQGAPGSRAWGRLRALQAARGSCPLWAGGSRLSGVDTAIGAPSTPPSQGSERSPDGDGSPDHGQVLGGSAEPRLLTEHLVWGALGGLWTGELACGRGAGERPSPDAVPRSKGLLLWPRDSWC